jgi:hypothetical protein
MIKLKVGGMILTGLAAFLVADKALGTVSQAVIGCCEASKWKGYYRCWSKGQAKGDPVPPGYSMTSRPDNADYEVVYDPSGKDHQHDNEPKEEGKRDHSEAVKTVCEAVKTVAEKAIDSLSKRSDEPGEAKEDDSEACKDENSFEPAAKPYCEDDICEDQDSDGDKSLVDMIDSVFNEEEKETDQDETVD